MARALCAADGQDPDEMVALVVEELGEKSESHHRNVLVPAWTSYDGEARWFIAAATALGLVE